ncbi:uncharacterized protein LOC113660631 isoform X2 [Tachysurus fulvidraco]|uniref:uncharacterized protein LOC113660631 isoform X2 n=1 Tax=Tachysurus fulvidraco TaxID=1234273 RepID=UPI001FEF8C1F|nr:uncharacterized protein LOC113660631 isoform X2 [Tachysurus fulvidraco]
MAQWLITAVQLILQCLWQIYSTMKHLTMWVKNAVYQRLQNRYPSHSSGQDEVDFTLTKITKRLMDFIPEKVGWPKELKFHILVIGNDLNYHKDILKSLGIKDKGISMDKSDVIIAFVPIVSRAGTDIQAALQMIPETRPAVLVVLHHTFSPDHIAPDSRRIIDRSNIFSVDMLFYENKGLLNCFKNTKALEETTKYLQNFKANRNKIINDHKMESRRDLLNLVWALLAFILWLITCMFQLVLKMTQWLITAVQRSWKPMLHCLCQVFSTMKPHANSVRNAVYQRLQNRHPSHSSGQDEVDFTLTKITKGLMDFIHDKVSVGEPEELKFHILVTGNDLNCHKDILKSLGIIDEGISMDKSDVIIAFVPIVSRAGTDIQAALQMIPESHHAVLVVLHHTFDPDHVAPDSGRNIDRSNIFSVDMLFYENMGMLNSYKNTKALEETTKYLQKFKANRNKTINGTDRCI